MEWHKVLPLTNEAVDEISERAASFLTELKTEQKNLLRIRLVLEEILLDWQARFSQQTSCRVKISKRLGRPFLQLELEGEPYNPLEQDTEDYGSYRNRLLANMGLAPLYTYENGRNRITFKLKKPRANPLLTLVLTVAAALLAGFAGTCLPEAFRTAILTQLLTPVYETFFRLLKTLAGPMVFLSVAWGICGIGDTATFGRIGKQMILHFLAVLFSICILSALLARPFFSLHMTSGSGGDTQLGSLLSMLWSFVPTDIITPFQTGNSMQIILLAVGVGIALLVLSRQTSLVTQAIEQINYIVQFLMELINRLISCFIFVVLVQMIWSGTLGDVLAAWKPLAVFLLLSVLCAAGLTVAAAIAGKTSPLLVLKKALPTLIIATTTASSVAAFGTCIGTCEKKLGVPNHLIGFGVPLGMVMFRAASAMCFLVIAMYAAELHAVDCSLTWFILAIVTAGILSIATPPIPGGALTSYTILFSQLGLPEEVLVVALALDVLFDFVATGVNMYTLQMEMVLQAKYQKQLDLSALQEE